MKKNTKIMATVCGIALVTVMAVPVFASAASNQSKNENDDYSYLIGNDGNAAVTNMEISNDGTAFATNLDGERALISYTTDGGKTWNEIDPENYSNEIGDDVDVASTSMEKNDNDAPFETNLDSVRAEIVHTTDGGQTWEAE